MDKEGMNVHIFKEAVANLAETRPGDMAEQTTYLELIAHSMACIADSLSALTEMERESVKLMREEFHNELEEEHCK